MAGTFTDTTTLANILARTYSREDYIAPHERVMARFWDSLEEDPDAPILGSAKYFPIFTADSHATGSMAESADYPDFNPPQLLQASVSPISVGATVAWSQLMMAVGQGDGLLGAKDIIQHHVKMTVRNLMSRLNWFTLGHGTGRLAVVEAATTTTTTFVCRLPEHVVQLRKGLKLEFYDTDTGGSKQTLNGSATTAQITHIDFETRTITLDIAVTLTAGWGVYQKGTYGVATNGLRGIVDNATLAASYCGITRSSNPEVNATVITTTTGLNSYSEKLMRKLINRIKFRTGMEPDEAWCNQGIIAEHLNHLTGNRIFTVAPGENVPKYHIGANEQELGIQHNGKFIPFKVDNDLPAREIYFLTKSLFRRGITLKPNWVVESSNDGSSQPQLFQATASGSTQGYSAGKLAMMLGILNIWHLQPSTTAAGRNISDEEMAGDAAA